MTVSGSSCGEPAAGPSRVTGVLAAAAVFAGIAFAMWLFGVLT